MHYRISFLLCCIVSGIIACNKSENFSSRITFINASTDSAKPAFTLKADSMIIASGIGYDSLVTNAVVPSGTYLLGLSSPGISGLSFTTNLAAGALYTGLVYDSVQKHIFFMRKDALPATPGEGRCAVRIYNLVQGTANLYLADTLRGKIYSKTYADFATSGSGPAFTEIDTIHNPVMRIDSFKTVATIPYPLKSGKIYTLFLTGKISDTGAGTKPYKPKFIVQVHN